MPKIDLTHNPTIALEKAGFKGNIYTHFYYFVYMFIVIVLIIILISLDTVKNKKIVDTRNTKNNIRPIDYEIKIENKKIPKKWFGK